MKLIIVLKNKTPNLFGQEEKTTRFNRAPAIGSITDGPRTGSSRQSPGRCTGVSTVSETVYSKHSAFVATLDSSASEQPQAYGKNLSKTCSVQNKEPSPAKLQSESSPVNIVQISSKEILGLLP